MIEKSEETKFDVHKLRVVDYEFGAFNETDNVNIIFRSNIPEDNSGKHFLYDDLVDNFVKKAKSEKLIRIEEKNLYVIDYSLLAEDDPLRETESKYWKRYPERGELRGWSVKGENENPRDYSEEEIITMSADLSWMRDSIEDWIDEIHETSLNFTNPAINVMILIHCQHGRDRTGEISGAYQLKYSRRSWEEVAATNYEANNNNPIKYSNQRALNWFCFHLKYHQNYTHLTCTTDNVDSNSEKTPKLLNWDIEDDNNIYEIAFYCILSFLILLCMVVVLVIVIVSIIFLAEYIRFRRKNTPSCDYSHPPLDEETNNDNNNNNNTIQEC